MSPAGYTGSTSPAGNSIRGGFAGCRTNFHNSLALDAWKTPVHGQPTATGGCSRWQKTWAKIGYK
eukprot:205073-Lingulodinium_polyedra.AAC.1